jgi:hypothetical protein
MEISLPTNEKQHDDKIPKLDFFRSERLNAQRRGRREFSDCNAEV